LPDSKSSVKYNQWHGEVKREDPPYLPELEFLDESKLKNIKQTLTAVATDQIRGAWTRLIEGVPA